MNPIESRSNDNGAPPSDAIVSAVAYRGGMTPSERAAAEGEFFAEYREKLRDVAVLQMKIEAAGRDLEALGRDIRLGRPLGGVAERLRGVTDLAATVADYRTTRARCDGLRSGLTRYGDDGSLAPLDAPTY